MSIFKMRIYGGVIAFFLLQCLVVANATPFQIGISVPETATTTNTCTDEERAFIAEKVAKYTATLVRVFFKDDSLVVDPEETSSGEVDSSYFDTAAFDDFQNFQAKKFLNAAVAGELDGLVNVAPVDGNSITPEQDPSTPVLVIDPVPNADGRAITEQPKPSCADTCISLDFETFPNSTSINGGAYISNEWKDVYGLTISVESNDSEAHMPLNGENDLQQPRIFDTSIPIEQFGNSALGSPNKLCPNSGPGIGNGGVPGTAYANCDPLGNVLIVQKNDQAVPEEASNGGAFHFEFDTPVKVTSVGLLDISNVYTNNIEIFKSSGSSRVFSVPDAGRNSMQIMDINEVDVVKITVTLTEGAAVTNVDFCIPCAADREIVGRQLSAGASDDASSIQGEPQYDKHRKLFIRYNFRWGVRSRWQCTGCTGDNADGRKRNLAMGWANADLNQYLVVALESVISFRLSMDLQWEVQDWLEQNNLPYGCFGNGDDLNVIFQLI